MEQTSKDKTELLSPAGDFECFLAAIAAGADAVYAGGDRFGARAYAKNFNSDELKEAIERSHLFDRKFYLTVNTILKNNEISELYDYIAPLYEAGLDGVIVQDLGVISVLSGMFPKLPLHASTQMAVTDIEGVRLLADMGIKRIVPARELSLSEIRKIYEATGMELECFIHGALCYSYSGKCLFSSILGGRSGNRGRCAQPCRLPYNGKYILSARDLMTLDILPELIGAGIASFKIEGRMKSKEYVATVTGIYRKYIDRFFDAQDEEYFVEQYDREQLDKIYTRSGHCDGYYNIRNGRSMISVDKPSYASGDDEDLKSLFQKYAGKDIKIMTEAKVKACKGEKLRLEFNCKGCSTVYYGEIVEASRKSPTGSEDIRKQIDKTGGTCFEFSEIDITCDDDIFIPVSSLNRARREGLQLLKDKIALKYRRNADEALVYNECIKESIRPSDDNKHYKKPKVNCRIDRIDMLDQVIGYDLADMITINVSAVNESNIASVTEKIHDHGKAVFFALPQIIRNGYLERNPYILNILKNGMADGITVDNYESLYFLRERRFKGVILSDLHMYAANDDAVNAYESSGIDVITYPVELNLKELKDLELKGGEFILYGRIPMMVSAQCVMKTQDRCIKDNGVSYIRDRYGNSFPCVRECGECFNTILNSVPTMITRIDDLTKALKPYSYRIHFTVESSSEIDKILSLYDDIFAKREFEDPGTDHTLGHLKRGVE